MRISALFLYLFHFNTLSIPQAIQPVMMESLVTDDPPLGHSLPQSSFEHRNSKFKCWHLPVQQSAR